MSIYSRLCMAALALVAVTGPPALRANQIICWTDENGRRACGDRVPPEYSRQERKVYDQSGRLVETLERQKTPAEIAEAERRAAEQEAERKRVEEQAAYDRFLLSAFSSVRDLEKTRDERLLTLDGRLRLAEKSLADNENGIAQLQSQIADTGKEGNKPPARLLRQLHEFEKTLADNRRAVDKLRIERDALVLQFARDIARYRDLTSEARPTPAPTGNRDEE